MICYRDRVYCSSPYCRNRCGRQLTGAIRLDAEAWWGGPDAPIALSDFCDLDGNVRSHPHEREEAVREDRRRE